MRGPCGSGSILVVVSLVLVGFGVNAAEHLSVDAFPDVANIQVQIATEAPGKSPEEVERFVTIPIEIAMTGLPGMTDMRSLNKPGLSLITLVFTDGSDLFRERQMISERLSELRDRMPEGVTPGARADHQCPGRGLPIHAGGAERK